VVRTLRIYFNNFVTAYSSINYICHYTLHSYYLSYNWKFIPFDCFYTIPPSATLTSGSHKYGLFFYEFVCFWSMIALWYYVSSCYTIKWCNISTCFKMITMVSLVTICHHTKIIHSYWPYSAHCTCRNCDSFIFVLQLEAGVSQSPSPIPFLPRPPSTVFFLATTNLFSVSITLFLFCCICSFVFLFF